MALDSLQWLRGELADLGQGLFLDLIICKTLNPPFVFSPSISPPFDFLILDLVLLQARVHKVIGQPGRLPSIKAWSACHNHKKATKHISDTC